jgi:hypothetical protein
LQEIINLIYVTSLQHPSLYLSYYFLDKFWNRHDILLLRLIDSNTYTSVRLFLFTHDKDIRDLEKLGITDFLGE